MMEEAASGFVESLREDVSEGIKEHIIGIGEGEGGRMGDGRNKPNADEVGSCT